MSGVDILFKLFFGKILSWYTEIGYFPVRYTYFLV